MAGVTFLLIPAVRAIVLFGFSIEALLPLPAMILDMVQRDFGSFLVVTLFLYLVYVPITVVALRNVRFHPVLKYSFCLLAVPVFAAFMVINIAWSSDHLQSYVDYAMQNTRRSNAKAAFLVAAPLAALVCFVWYLLFFALDWILKRIRQQTPDS